MSSLLLPFYTMRIRAGTERLHRHYFSPEIFFEAEGLSKQKETGIACLHNIYLFLLSLKQPKKFRLLDALTVLEHKNPSRNI